MNILILSNSDSGLYQFRKEVIEALSKKHTVTCSVPNADGYIDKLEELGCKCIPTEFNRRGKNPIEDLVLLHKYHSFIKKIRPGVVLTYTIKPNVYGGIACQLHKIPYLSNVTGLGTTIENGGIISKISLILYRIGLRGATCVFFQNKQNMKLFKTKKIVRGPVRLIPGSGVNYVNLKDKTGFEVPNGDRRAYAEAIEQLANNTALRNVMGQEAKNRVAELFLTSSFRTNILNMIQYL